MVDHVKAARHRREFPTGERCVVLRFLCELSVAETAEAMNRDVRAVRALQYRAVRRLAALLVPSIPAS